MPNDKSTEQVSKEETPPGAAQDEPLTLTKAELQKLIDDNRTESSTAAKEEARRELEAEREQERKAAEAKLAKEQGKFKELYEAEQAAAAKAAAEAADAKLALRKAEVHGRLRDYVAANHDGYSNAVKYMTPLLVIDAKTDDAEADKQIKAVAEAYVKDNPRAAKGGGAPSSPAHGQRLPAGQKPTGANGHRPAQGEVAMRHF